jgi:VIT1/CCC1 family predicted Fe2+/Mn2+ transporter
MNEIGTTVEISSAEKEKILGEKERVEKRGRIRQFVFGSMDGLLVPLGVVSGVAGGTGSTKAVVIAGLAEAFAGALSMGAGEFLSGRAEAQVHVYRGAVLSGTALRFLTVHSVPSRGLTRRLRLG